MEKSHGKCKTVKTMVMNINSLNVKCRLKFGKGTVFNYSIKPDCVVLQRNTITLEIPRNYFDVGYEVME